MTDRLFHTMIIIIIIIIICELLSPCFAAGEWNSAEIFKRPDEEVFVLVGASVSLNCSIEIAKSLVDQGHDATWLKHGRFVLLPDASGHVLGDSRLKIVHNQHFGASLQIDHARTDDTGRFECLSPDGQRSTPIFLTVIEPPSDPVVLAVVDAPLIAIHGKRADFVCQVENGNPRPQFKWYISDKSSEKESENEAWQLVSVEWASIRTNETSTTSVLTLDGSALFSKMALKCSVIHHGYSGGVANVTFKPNVLVPPSSLTIWPRPSTPVIANSTLKTTCSVVAPESEQPVSLVWVRNGRSLPPSSLRRLGNLLISELEFTILPEDNFALFRCEAQSELIEQPLYEQFQLIVHFHPMPASDTTTLISASSDWVVANSPLKMKCMAVANPGSRITWQRDSVSITELPMTHNESPTANGLGIVTNSEVDVVFTASQFVRSSSWLNISGIAATNVTCVAGNSVGSSSSSLTIKVVLPPTRLAFIIGKNMVAIDNSDNLKIRTGQVLQISCLVDRTTWLSSKSSNSNKTMPAWISSLVQSITYKWLQAEDHVLLAESSSLSLFVSPGWNGRELICVANSDTLFPATNSNNPATASGRHVLQRRIRLDVSYSPGPPTIQLGEGLQMPVREGTEVTATCFPSTGNPQPTARWIVQSIQPSVLGPAFVTERAIGGGSTIRFKASAYVDGVGIVCEAFNQLGRNTSELLVSTLYRPVFTDCPSDVTVLLSKWPNGAISPPEYSKLVCRAKSSPVFTAGSVWLTFDNDNVTHEILNSEQAVAAFLDEGRLNLPRNLLETKLPFFKTAEFVHYFDNNSPQNIEVRSDDEHDPLMTFEDAATVAITITIANQLGKASRTIFVRFVRSDNLVHGSPDDVAASEPNILLSSSASASPTSSSALSILVACLTAIGVMLIAANILFISLYVARRAIVKRTRNNKMHNSCGGNGTKSSSCRTNRLSTNLRIQHDSDSKRLRLEQHGAAPAGTRTCHADRDANMLEMLLGETDRRNNNCQQQPPVPMSHPSTSKKMLLEDVASLALKRNNSHHLLAKTSSPLARFREEFQRQHPQRNSDRNNGDDVLSEENVNVTSHDEETADDSDSGRGESNRGVLLLEAICSSSPASNSTAGEVPNAQTCAANHLKQLEGTRSLMNGKLIAQPHHQHLLALRNRIYVTSQSTSTQSPPQDHNNNNHHNHSHNHQIKSNEGSLFSSPPLSGATSTSSSPSSFPISTAPLTTFNSDETASSPALDAGEGKPLATRVSLQFIDI